MAGLKTNKSNLISRDQKAVFGMLRQGEGRVIITASFEDKIQKVRLPAMDSEAAVKDFFEILFEELRCEPFFDVKQDSSDPEDEPLKNGLKRKASSSEVTLTFNDYPPTLTPETQSSTTPKRLSLDPASFYATPKANKAGSKPRGRPPGTKNKEKPPPPSVENPTASTLLPSTSPVKNGLKNGPIYQNAHKLHLEQEKAKAMAFSKQSATLPALSVPAPPSLAPFDPSTLPDDPTLWSIGNVINYIGDLDPSLRPHVEMFKSHEIDGNALLLLTSDMMMKYMNMKLGPALKICNIINKIHGEKFQPVPKNII